MSSSHLQVDNHLQPPIWHGKHLNLLPNFPHLPSCFSSSWHLLFEWSISMPLFFLATSHLESLSFPSQLPTFPANVDGFWSTCPAWTWHVASSTNCWRPHIWAMNLKGKNDKTYSCRTIEHHILFLVNMWYVCVIIDDYSACFFWNQISMILYIVHETTSEMPCRSLWIQVPFPVTLVAGSLLGKAGEEMEKH